MMLNVPVLPPPQPVLPFKINVEYKYIVVRGDGSAKIFDTVWGGGDGAWHPRQHLPFDTNTTIPIPMDLITALMLGLVQPHELELPEHLKAFVNMIKP